MKTRWGYGAVEQSPAVVTLVFSNVGAYFVLAVADWLTGGQATYVIGLSWRGLSRGYLWQPVTYMFAHAGPWHLVLNMLMLYFAGRATEQIMGARHFLLLYVASGALAGVGWLLLSPPHAYCVGASGAVLGVLGAFAALEPHRPITLLLFFAIPVTLPAWKLAALLALFELAFLVSGSAGHVAYAAHVAGIVAGYVYALACCRGWPAWLQGPRRAWRAFWRRRTLQSERRFSEELDRILDKIARQGVSSLTRRERELLDRASQRSTSTSR